MLAGAMDPGEGSAQPAEPHHTPVDPLPSHPIYYSLTTHSLINTPITSSIKPRFTTSITTLFTTSFTSSINTSFTKVKILENGNKRNDTKGWLYLKSDGLKNIRIRGRVNSGYTNEPLVSLEGEQGHVAKIINTGLLDSEEWITTSTMKKFNIGIEEVITGSTKVDSGTASKRGQREGKASMVEEDIQATHKLRNKKTKRKLDWKRL
ncbi:hypothetical protein Tco_0300896 [Tanacetum coccineum]